MSGEKHILKDMQWPPGDTENVTAMLLLPSVGVGCVQPRLLPWVENAPYADIQTNALWKLTISTIVAVRTVVVGRGGKC